MIKDSNVLKRNYNMLGQSNKVWSTHMEHRLNEVGWADFDTIY